MKEFWMITTFWGPHPGSGGERLSGGYEAKWIDKHPSDELLSLRNKYGPIVSLINAIPVTVEQYYKAKGA